MIFGGGPRPDHSRPGAASKTRRYSNQLTPGPQPPQERCYNAHSPASTQVLRLIPSRLANWAPLHPSASRLSRTQAPGWVGLAAVNNSAPVDSLPSRFPLLPNLQTGRSGANWRIPGPSRSLGDYRTIGAVSDQVDPCQLEFQQQPNRPAICLCASTRAWANGWSLPAPKTFSIQHA